MDKLEFTEDMLNNEEFMEELQVIDPELIEAGDKTYLRVYVKDEFEAWRKNITLEWLVDKYYPELLK